MTKLQLPEYAARCLEALESAGFTAYAVGGCVRDMLLGLTPQDYDLCTSASPEQIKTVFAGQPMVLAGEKHVSGLYDTCVFEFRNNQARSVLNHIQKEEQEHGKLIYDYMAANNMYS